MVQDNGINGYIYTHLCVQLSYGCIEWRHSVFSIPLGALRFSFMTLDVLYIGFVLRRMEIFENIYMPILYVYNTLDRVFLEPRFIFSCLSCC